MTRWATLLVLAGWAIAFVLVASGRFVAGGGANYVPFAAFPAACMLALGDVGDAERRWPAVAVAILAFASAIAYAFALVVAFVLRSGF